jgi:hypothetical protein
MGGLYRGKNENNLKLFRCVQRKLINVLMRKNDLIHLSKKRKNDLISS